jgi:hypothetical protein
MAFNPNQQRAKVLLAGDRNEFLLDQHGSLGPHHIVNRPTLWAAMRMVTEVIKLTGQAANRLAPGDPALIQARVEADYHVLPPHYMYIRLGSQCRIHSNDPTEPIASKQGAPVPKQRIGKQVAVHRFGLNLQDPHDPRIYVGALMPDTRKTAPVVISMPELNPDAWRFDSAARIPPDTHHFIDPTMLLS